MKNLPNLLHRYVILPNDSITHVIEKSLNLLYPDSYKLFLKQLQT